MSQTSTDSVGHGGLHLKLPDFLCVCLAGNLPEALKAKTKAKDSWLWVNKVYYQNIAISNVTCWPIVKFKIQKTHGA